MPKAIFGYRYKTATTPDVKNIDVEYYKFVKPTKYMTVKSSLKVNKTTYGKRMNVESEEISFDNYASLVKDIPRDGLVGEWLFFEGYGDRLHDTSGVNPPNDGTIYGMSWDTLPSGKVVGNLDGVDDFVSIPYSDSLNSIADTNRVTMLVWIKLKKIGSYKFISLNYGFYIGYTVATNSFETYLRKANGTILSDRYAPTRFNVNPKEWHLVVGVYDGEYLRTIIDGKIYKETKAHNLDLSGISILGCKIGCNITATHDFTNAYIGVARIYNQALTLDQINEIYEIEKPLFV